MEYRRKPLSIILVAIGHFLAPLFYFGQIPYLVNLQTGYSYSFTDLPRILELYPTGKLIYLIFLSLFVIAVGVGIFKVRLWGWYIFLIHSAFIFVVNLLLIANPNSNIILLLIFEAITIGVAAYFTRREISSPYFNPRLRWWETKSRYFAGFNATFPDGGMKGTIQDISETGCYVETDQIPGEVMSKESHIEIDGMGVKLNMSSKIVRISSKNAAGKSGLGLRFINLSKEQKQLLRQLLEKLKNEKGIKR